MKKVFATLLLLAIYSFGANSTYGQDSLQDSPSNQEQKKESPDFKLVLQPKLGGVLFTRYEFHTGSDSGQRFQVRNARLNLSGELNDYMDYMFQYDFSDEGKGKVVDAFVRIKPLGTNKFSLALGQMRAPFTIDAHRGPDTQHFNNRSFISRIGGVRDIGIMGEFNFALADVPMTLQAGVFNGDSFEDQKELRKNFMMYQAKYQAQITNNIYFSASHRNLRPGEIRENMWDAGFRFTIENFLFESEYMLQTYGHNAFKDVHYVNAFFCYDVPIKNPGLSKVSFLGRYDFMSDYSDGLILDETTRKLSLTTSRRSRATAGITFSIAQKAFKGDIRINYEKYFYSDQAYRPKYENDRVVVGLVVSF